MNHRLLRPLPSLIVLASASVAHAHPGHAGHEFTGDPSSHGALAILLGVAVVCAGVWAAQQFPSWQQFVRRATAGRNRPSGKL